MIDTPIRLFLAKLTFILISLLTVTLSFIVFFAAILLLVGGVSFLEDVFYNREKGNHILFLMIFSFSIGGRLGVYFFGIPIWQKVMNKTGLISKNKIREFLKDT